MSRPLFHPSLRQSVCLAAIALAAVGYALHLRYQVIEQAAVGIACESGAHGWTCTSRKTAISLYNASVFGIAATIAALLNLLRPSVVFCAVALLAAGLGIVLYNVGLSALAVALLIVSLARTAPEPE